MKTLPALIACAFLLAGCGDADSGNKSIRVEEPAVTSSPKPDPAAPDGLARPTVAEVREAIESDSASMGYTGEVALCAAEVLVNSKLSDKTLRGAVEGVQGEPTPPLTQSDKKILNSKAFKSKYTKCTNMLKPAADKAVPVNPFN